MALRLTGSQYNKSDNSSVFSPSPASKVDSKGRERFVGKTILHIYCMYINSEEREIKFSKENVVPAWHKGYVHCRSSSRYTIGPVIRSIDYVLMFVLEWNKNFVKVEKRICVAQKSYSLCPNLSGVYIIGLPTLVQDV